MAVNLEIDSRDENATTNELREAIDAIQGFAVSRGVNRKDLRTRLERLQQWSRNFNGMTGIAKGLKVAPVLSYEEIVAKARAKGVDIPELPKSHEKIVPFDPEFDDEADFADVDVTAPPSPEPVAVAPEPAVARPSVSVDTDAAAVTRGTLQDDSQAEAMPPEVAPEPAPVGPAPFPFTKTAQGVTVEVDGETITHKRGTLRARLAEQAANANPITPAASAMKDRRPKKETGEARKPREALLAVKATFAGTSKLHSNNEARRTRFEVLTWVQMKALREIPGWPKGAVLIDEFGKQFPNKDVRPFIHKLIEDGHLTRVNPEVPKD